MWESLITLLNRDEIHIRMRFTYVWNSHTYKMHIRMRFIYAYVGHESLITLFYILKWNSYTYEIHNVYLYTMYMCIQCIFVSRACLRVLPHPLTPCLLHTRWRPCALPVSRSHVTHCGIPQHTAIYCNTPPQHTTATYRNILQHTTAAPYRNIPQYTTTHYRNTLTQHIATYCNTLPQHIPQHA